MKRIYSTILTIFIAVSALAQGWPENYGGVMLQGFYWDSFKDSKWKTLEAQADELAQYFNLIWVPQSGKCNEAKNMGYTPVYYFNQNSSFGTEAELRSMISTFKSKGLGTIADVVVNHRNNIGVGGSWVDYPAETYNGVTYQMKSTDICANDDGGKTKTWATANGYSLSSAYDEGEDWSGCRDLDHTSSNVQNCIIAYEKFLLNDLGYTGFRYDMTKGFAAYYVGMYNDKSGVQYSVGEYWDGDVTKVKKWIDDTKYWESKIWSASFDFPFRYTVRDAANGSNWTKLGNTALMKQSGYSRYAVTFVENHDTQYRSATDQQDPIRKDTLAANAYLLAMPGTPCVFMRHWQDYKQEIKAMIDARKAAGVKNTSSFVPMASNTAYYAVLVNKKLLAVVGNNAGGYTANTSQYTPILSGYHYRYYMKKDAEIAWADKASGTFEEGFKVTLTAVSNDANAKLVYTTDGTNPTASSKQVASGTKIDINATTTLKVGLLKSGAVSSIITRNYSIVPPTPFEPYKATVYLKDPKWTSLYFWCWDSDGKNFSGGTWPGKTPTDYKEINGEKWYYQTVDITKRGYYFNIIFNQGKDKPQSEDLEDITQDTYYEVTKVTGTAGTCVEVKDVTDTMTGIADITVDKPSTGNNAYYTLSGVRVAKPTQPGIYIHNGRKVVVK